MRYLFLLFFSFSVFGDWDDVDWESVKEICYLRSSEVSGCYRVYDECRTPSSGGYWLDEDEYETRVVRDGKHYSSHKVLKVKKKPRYVKVRSYKGGSKKFCEAKEDKCRFRTYQDCIVAYADRYRGNLVWIWEEEFWQRTPFDER